MVAVYLRVDEGKTITDIKFESYGCASNIATGSIITELAKGRRSTGQGHHLAGGLRGPRRAPPIKTHCSVLAVDGLRAAIQNYERHGLVREQVPTDLDEIRRRLKHVMNPVVGLDLVRTKMVKDMEIADGTVRVVIDLPADHQFAANIAHEIRDKIEPLWDVERVVVEFSE